MSIDRDLFVYKHMKFIDRTISLDSTDEPSTVLIQHALLLHRMRSLSVIVLSCVRARARRSLPFFFFFSFSLPTSLPVLPLGLCNQLKTGSEEKSLAIGPYSNDLSCHRPPFGSEHDCVACSKFYLRRSSRSPFDSNRLVGVVIIHLTYHGEMNNSHTDPSNKAVLMR